MSDIVAATRTHLLTQSGITDLVGTRIYYGVLPQAATLPAITLELSQSEIADRHLAATGSLHRSQVNVYCYAASQPAAAALAAAVAASTATEFQSGAWSTTTVTRCFVDSEIEVAESPRDGSDAWRHVRGVFLAIWHN